MTACAILLLAAGASSRMRGGDKLLEPVGGMPVLRRQALAALACGVPVLVALPTDKPARNEALCGLGVTCVPVMDAALGMSASIRAGVGALPPGTNGVAILPADMPDLTHQDLADVLQKFSQNPDRILRATSWGGTPGHPVVFPARLFPGLCVLRGDQGARDLIRGETVLFMPLPDDHAITDLDTPEDWAAWRAARKT